MLCRVADSLFWISRYIERAENIVRFVDVTLLTLLDSEEASDEVSYEIWSPILSSLGDRALFESLYEVHNSTNVTDFLTFNRENPSSVYNCIAFARENARMVRDQISGEMWGVINKLYLYIKKQDSKRICEDLDFSFFEYIKEQSLLFQGVTDSTISHRTGYFFMECGRYLERADKTSRIVESKKFMRTNDEGRDALDASQWTAILKGTSAAEAYYQAEKSVVNAQAVLFLLLLDHTFPRSAIYCIQRLQLAMHNISGCPITHFTNEAERNTGKLLSELNYFNAKDLATEKGAEFIEEIQKTLESIALEISNQYMFFDIVDPAAEMEQ
ncbi:MAG: alpha-E domain-containing protein [Opitutaceae bacterium]